MLPVLVILGIVAVQSAAGAVWWAWARRSDTVQALEVIGMGIALGTVVSGVFSVVLATTPAAPWAWALPALATALALQWPAVRRARPAHVIVSAREAWAAAIGIATGGALLVANWVRVPLDAQVTDSYTDLPFLEALSRGLAAFGPNESILMAGGTLRYHWFTYGWAGELQQLSAAAPFYTLTRVLPVVALVGVSLLVAAWARRLSDVRWTPALAVLLVVVSGYAGALYGSILNFDSPSQTLTTLWLLALAIAFLQVIEGPMTLWRAVLLAALGSATTGGKVSHAIVAAAGVAAVVVVGSITRQPWRRRACIAAAVIALGMSLTYLLVLSGVAVDRNLTEAVAVKASTWQGMDPLMGRWGPWLGTGAVLIATWTRLMGVPWLLTARRTRWAAPTWFAIGSVVAGTAALIAMSEGVNELWFILAASAPASVVSAAGVAAAARWLHHRPARVSHPLVIMVVIAAAPTVACLILSMNWPTYQRQLNWAAPVAAWLLVILTAGLLTLRNGLRGRPAIKVICALTFASLPLVAIGTRPAVLWTSTRPITTETGAVQPAPVASALSAGGLGASDQQQVYADQRSASQWLRKHSSGDDVIITTNPVSSLIPALTGRSMYIAGARYQAGLGKPDELDDLQARVDDSLLLAKDPTLVQVERLCLAGTRFAWIEGPAPAGLDGLWRQVYANPSVSIWALRPEFCP